MASYKHSFWWSVDEVIISKVAWFIYYATNYLLLIVFNVRIPLDPFWFSYLQLQKIDPLASRWNTRLSKSDYVDWFQKQWNINCRYWSLTRVIWIETQTNLCIKQQCMSTMPYRKSQSRFHCKNATTTIHWTFCFEAHRNVWASNEYWMNVNKGIEL